MVASIVIILLIIIVVAIVLFFTPASYDSREAERERKEQEEIEQIINERQEFLKFMTKEYGNSYDKEGKKEWVLIRHNGIKQTGSKEKIIESLCLMTECNFDVKETETQVIFKQKLRLFR